ncbi:hypothetical protein Nepgr_005692 [Nepenthes gracilis]|uniref:Uncharacterized protein n=1 Tax=Nepenthes gracilis TaxID=150966 RepID=A0AAD3XGP7_NEPGR|nr:hypothetical protein Nepgr_005692 [Nepenthes gracilis]
MLKGLLILQPRNLEMLGLKIVMDGQQTVNHSITTYHPNRLIDLSSHLFKPYFLSKHQQNPHDQLKSLVGVLAPNSKSLGEGPFSWSSRVFMQVSNHGGKGYCCEVQILGWS